MTWRDDQPPHRHSLTPIGDELESRSHPLEVGQPSEMDLVRRRASRLEWLLPRPSNRVEQIAYGLILFALILGVVAGLAYLVGLVFDHEGASRTQAMLIVFLVGGVAVGVPPLIIFPWGAAIPAWLYRNRRSGEPVDEDEDEGAAALPKYGMWQFHWAFWVALGLSLVVMGFGIWGRGSNQNDPYLGQLEALVAPDWGKVSASCKSSQGRLSLCTVRGVEKSDQFQVCVTWKLQPRPQLVYSPLKRCGVVTNAPAVAQPSIGLPRYRASASAACLRRKPDVEVLAFQTVWGSGRDPDGTELRVAFQPPQGVRSIADAYFLKDEEMATGWYPLAAGAYRRRNVVVEWGNRRPAYVSRFNACLAS